MSNNNENKNEVDEDYIRKLWRTPSFAGSFSGIATFRAALEHEKNIKISKDTLFKIFRKDPDYILEMKTVRKTFPRRKMIVHGVASLWQADIAIMFPSQDFMYFLLCIDVFSHKIFCKALKTKHAKSIKKAFEAIFRTAALIPDKLETDQGTEFTGNKSFFKEKNIFFKVKTGRHKAAFAERAIQTVKQKLYRLLRTLMTKDWPQYLNAVVSAINKLPNKAIGGLRPADITSKLDTPKIDRAIGVAEDVTYEEQQKNQKTYETNKKNIQVGDHVHVDFGPATFGKSYDTRNYQIYKVARIDAGKSPPLFKLVDLMDDGIAGYFYREQLTKTMEPKNGETFRIEKLIKSEERNGKLYYYVKYTHYPDKFNQWIPASNFD